MNFQEILEKIKEKFEIVEYKEDLGVLNATINKKDIREVIKFLKDSMNFNHLNFLTAIDWINNNIIEIIYHLYSYNTKSKVVIRVKLDRNSPEIDTISDIFKTAEWHERETYEMFGVKFINHPDLRKLLLPDDIDKPLLKDFKHPDMEKLPEV